MLNMMMIMKMVVVTGFDTSIRIQPSTTEEKSDQIKYALYYES